MSSDVVIAIVAVVVVAAIVALFLRNTRRHDPERTAGHQRVDPLPDGTAGPIGTQAYPGVDRPAGPGAESERVTDPGTPTPGPETHRPG